MAVSDSDITKRLADLKKRRKGALGAARGGAIYGVLLAIFALLDLVGRLEAASLGLNFCHHSPGSFGLALVDRLSCAGGLSVAASSYVGFGIVLEILLILIFAWRMQTGKGLISAVLLFFLFATEVGFMAANGLGVDERGGLATTHLVAWSALALLLGMGVWGTWRYRRLSRELQNMTGGETGV